MMAPEKHEHCIPAADGSCSICSDEAIVGLVGRVNYAEQTAEVYFEKGSEVIALDLVNDVAKGDTVLVHMGFAISRMRPGE